MQEVYSTPKQPEIKKPGGFFNRLRRPTTIPSPIPPTLPEIVEPAAPVDVTPKTVLEPESLDEAR